MQSNTTSAERPCAVRSTSSKPKAAAASARSLTGSLIVTDVVPARRAAAGNKQANRPGTYDMGTVSEAHLAPTNRVHRYSEGLDKRCPLEVERRRQRHQVVAGHRQQLGRATVHIYPDEAEAIADMGAAAATGPTGPAWKKRVDEHRCPSLQVIGRLQQAPDDLMTDYKTGPGTRMLTSADVKISSAEPDVCGLDKRPPGHPSRRRDFRRLDYLATSPHKCLHPASCFGPGSLVVDIPGTGASSYTNSGTAGMRSCHPIIMLVFDLQCNTWTLSQCSGELG